MMYRDEMMMWWDDMTDEDDIEDENMIWNENGRGSVKNMTLNPGGGPRGGGGNTSPQNF